MVNTGHYLRHGITADLPNYKKYTASCMAKIARKVECQPGLYDYRLGQKCVCVSDLMLFTSNVILIGLH